MTGYSGKSLLRQFSKSDQLSLEPISARKDFSLGLAMVMFSAGFPTGVRGTCLASPNEPASHLPVGQALKPLPEAPLLLNNFLRVSPTTLICKPYAYSFPALSKTACDCCSLVLYCCSAAIVAPACLQAARPCACNFPRIATSLKQCKVFDVENGASAVEMALFCRLVPCFSAGLARVCGESGV